MAIQREVMLKKPLYTLATPIGEIDPIWLKHIEPYIIRKGYLPCWLWNGSQDSNKGYPLFYDPTAPKNKRRQISVRNWVARFFYDFPETGWYVTRNRDICPYNNCLNPAHILITSTHPRWIE